MIPKLLHFVWLSGDPLPPLIEQCRKSWEKWLPEYEWVLWDKKKIEGIENEWLKQTLETGNWAFATDFLRIYALYHHGGIYLDADVEVIGSFDPFLKHKFFIGFGFNDDLEPAVFGSVAAHPLLKELLGYYLQKRFIKENGQYDRRPLPLVFNEKTSKFGFSRNGKQQLLKEDIKVYPCEYFSPKNLYFKDFKITTRTVAIHHLVSGWVNKGWKYKSKIIFHQLIYIIGGKWVHAKFVSLIRHFG